MPARRQPEQTIQRSVVQHLRYRGARGAVWWHVPNGGARRKTEAAILKGLGVRARVADICVVHDGKFFALELKAPSGRSTAAQIAFRDEINAAGGFACRGGADRCRAALFGVLGAAARAGAMSRGPCRFTRRDLTKAVKAVVAAGQPVVSVRVEKDGAIIVIVGRADKTEAARNAASNSWETL